jgi:hypothetical protein
MHPSELRLEMSVLARTVTFERAIVPERLEVLSITAVVSD